MSIELRKAAHAAGMIDLANVALLPDSDASPAERVAAHRASHPEHFTGDVRSMTAQEFKAALATALRNGSQIAAASRTARELASMQEREQQRQAQAEIEAAEREKRRQQQAQIDAIAADMRRGRHARSY